MSADSPPAASQCDEEDNKDYSRSQETFRYDGGMGNGRRQCSAFPHIDANQLTHKRHGDPYQRDKRESRIGYQLLHSSNGGYGVHYLLRSRPWKDVSPMGLLNPHPVPKSPL